MKELHEYLIIDHNGVAKTKWTDKEINESMLTYVVKLRTILIPDDIVLGFEWE